MMPSFGLIAYKKCVKCGGRYRRWSSMFTDRYLETTVIVHSPLITRGYCEGCFIIENAKIDKELAQLEAQRQ